MKPMIKVASSIRRTFLKVGLSLPFALRTLFSVPMV